MNRSPEIGDIQDFQKILKKKGMWTPNQRQMRKNIKVSSYNRICDLL